MAELEQIIDKLKHMLDAEVNLRTWNPADRVDQKRRAPESKSVRRVSGEGRLLNENDFLSLYDKMKTGESVLLDGAERWFKASISGDAPAALAVSADAITEKEAGLISLLLQQMLAPEEAGKALPQTSKNEAEQQVKRLGIWVKERLMDQEHESPLPDEHKDKLAFRERMIPFLLTNESQHDVHISYKALQRLLRSYFDAEVVLIPLESNEWMFLADPKLLEGLADEKEGPEEENGQDLLSLFCMGLYELVSNEWVGDFHVAASSPVNPMKELVVGYRMLRETLLIGRTFHVKERIYLASGLHLERLLYSIPEEQRTRFLEEHASRHSNVFEDEETISTLETFFELDCNVSETAKRLYIHRNTLLYRLDKIKQETGLDVRSFGDAVLVKLTLLLYKLTKRK